MATHYLAHAVFAVAIGGSIASLALIYVQGQSALWLAGASACVNVVSVAASESGRFATTRQMRRAYEPRRAFNAAETLLLLGIVMFQIGLGLYVVLTSSAPF